MAADLKIVPGEVELSADQVAALKAADGWVQDAMAKLGATYLEHQEAEIRAKALRYQLGELGTKARETELQRAEVLRVIAETFDLPPGEWTYDGEQSKLVMKEPPNDKPT